MTVLNLTGLHIQLDWPEGTEPTPDQLANLHKWFNEVLFKLEGQPYVMSEFTDWSVEVADDDIPQVSDLISHVEVVA